MDPKDCLFCKITKGEIPSKKVYEDDKTFVILDINPRNPGHVLVIPKSHYETIFDMSQSDVGDMFKVAKEMAGRVKTGVKADGVSLCQSNGRAAGQMVLHTHVHVIPRFNTEGPPGLESILPVKRMDDGSLDKIVEALQKASPSTPAPTPKPTKPAKEETSDEKDEDINFRF